MSLAPAPETRRYWIRAWAHERVRHFEAVRFVRVLAALPCATGTQCGLCDPCQAAAWLAVTQEHES